MYTILDSGIVLPCHVIPMSQNCSEALCKVMGGDRQAGGSW